MQNEISSNKNVTPGYGAGYSTDGFSHGQSATDFVGFFGKTPIVQPTNAAQAAITDSSGGTASATSGVQAITSTYNGPVLANAIATILAQNAQLRLALVNLGLIKGS